MTDETEALRWLTWLQLQTVEIRALQADSIEAGVFSDRRAAADTACGLAGNVYCTVNELADHIQPREYTAKVGRGACVKNADVTRLRHLILDIDPIRAASTAATDTEHQAALDLANAAATAMGWPAPAVVDSGNGAYCIWKIDLPPGDESLVKAALVAFSAKLNNAQASVDTSVGNPARILRVPGTMNCKGTSTDERPHRMAKIIALPATSCVTREQLVDFAGEPEKETGEFDIANPALRLERETNTESVLAKAGLAYKKRQTPAATFYDLTLCPFKGQADGNTAVIVWANGNRVLKCHHAKCGGLGWSEFLATLDSDGEQISLRKPEGRTDAANARRFVAEHGDSVFYCDSHWYCWDGHRFARDDRRAVEVRAGETAKDLWRELANAATGESKIMQGFASYSNSAKGMRDMLAVARSLLAVSRTELDANPWHFNCRNGTIDLQTGQLREHRREDRITKLAPVDFDPNAKCELWQRTLEKILSGNANLIRFLQCWLGYNLTADVSEQAMVFFHGGGANGKSLTVETVLGIHGDYGLKAPPGLLVMKRGDSHPTIRATLSGKRAVLASETDQKALLDEAAVKDMTGGERQNSRRMREDYAEFQPTHKITVATNHLPTIYGNDHAIWRRIRLVPFTVVIPDREQDKRLGEKLKAEWPGILAWMVRGCLDWQANGLDVPAEVTAATAAYRSNEDQLTTFLAECCEVGPDKQASAESLRSAYRDFVGDELPPKAFAALLRSRGFQSERMTSGASKGRMKWLGLAVGEG